MIVAFTTKGSTWESKINPRFGRAENFVIYDESTDILSSVSNLDSGKEAHGAGPKAAQKLIEVKADVLITGTGPGGNAALVLEKGGVESYINADNMTVREAYSAFKNGELTKF